MFRLLAVVVLFALSSLKFAHAFTITLEPDKWYLLSVPGAVDRSVADIVGDQLDADDLDQNWVIYAFDSQSQRYRQNTPDMELTAGDAFWLLHMHDDAVDLQVALDAPTVDLIQQSGCASSIGCFEYALPTGDNVAWSLLGSPFPEGVAIAEIRLVTYGGPCSGGCTLEAAQEMGISNASFFGYDEAKNKYNTLSGGEYIEAGEGYWLTTRIPAEYSPARLIMPTFCTPIDT
ncbi:hypothetical protein N9383_05130 [Granulosicoccus sp.]|nr:hypothetical protein [Granulosicoccus sp.]